MKIIGHRGAKGLAPENTIASVQVALDAGVDEVEIDARVTLDGVVVLYHDHIISGMNQPIASLNFADLRQVTTLEETIRLIDRRVPLVIEVKPHEATAPVVILVKRFLKEGWTPDDFFFASFSQRTLKALYTALPSVPIIVNEPWSGVRATYRARSLNARRLCMNHHYLWFGFVAAISKKYQLTVYPLNNPAKARRWQRHGLYGVVTDLPQLFK